MEADTLDLPELARYLNRDLRDLEKLASRGRLPGKRVGGRWTINRAEVHSWLERGVPDFDERQLAEMETTFGVRRAELVVAPLMSPERVSLRLEGRTAPGVLSALVALANVDWHIYDPDRLLAAVREREASQPTALAGGVAVPHPSRRQPDNLAESLVAFGRAPGGVPFGDPEGRLTDLFFLIACRDDAAHLRVLARLARLFFREGFLDSLRAADTPADVVTLVADAESEVR